jgi:putative FmdB family regulatory protein
MPLYEYRCEGCGRRFEVLQRVGATAEGLECPVCRDPRLERAFSPFARATGAPAAEAGASVPTCAPSGAFS